MATVEESAAMDDGGGPPTSEKNSFGWELKARREQLGFSIKKLATLSAVSRRCIVCAEQGRNITLEVLKKLMRAMNLTTITISPGTMAHDGLTGPDTASLTAAVEDIGRSTALAQQAAKRIRTVALGRGKTSLKESHDDSLRFTITTLLDRAHDSMAGAPREAVALTRSATILCSSYLTHDGNQNFALEGDAWRAHAGALMWAGDYSEAERACLQSRSFYHLAGLEDRSYELAMLNVIQARVAHFLGDGNLALELADAASAALARDFPAKKRDYVRARTVFATILVADFQRYDEGLKALQECAELARLEGDTESLASLTNNIGHVYARIGDLKAARECFSTALEAFTSLGLKTEMPRVRGGLSRILMQEGRYDEALSEHYKARAAYLDLGMPVVAAEVTARIIESLFAAGRMNDIPTLCAQAVETFTNANLPREAAKALSYLNASAQQRTLTTDDVEAVREFLQRLQADPEERFAATSQAGST